MSMKPYPQPILLRLSDVSDVAANTAHRSAYVTTTLPAIVQGLRNLECQPDPFNEFQGPDALFSRLLAALAGTTEYDAVMGNEVERLNAMLADQVEKAEQARIELEDERERVNVQREDIRTLRLEVQRLTEELDSANADAEGDERLISNLRTNLQEKIAQVQRLTEEARRSDAGRVEVPELAPYSEDHPDYQHEGGPVVDETGIPPEECIRSYQRGYNFARSRSRLSPSPQPSADVVVVPRDDARDRKNRAWEDYRETQFNAWKAGQDALRSSTNHDSKETL